MGDGGREEGDEFRRARPEMAGSDSDDCSVEWMVPSSPPMDHVRCHLAPAASNPLPGIMKQDSHHEGSGRDLSS